MNEPKRQKLGRWKSWQQRKHRKLYSDIPQALSEGKFERFGFPAEAITQCVHPPVPQRGAVCTECLTFVQRYAATLMAGFSTEEKGELALWFQEPLTAGDIVKEELRGQKETGRVMLCCKVILPSPRLPGPIALSSGTADD